VLQRSSSVRDMVGRAAEGIWKDSGHRLPPPGPSLRASASGSSLPFEWVGKASSSDGSGGLRAGEDTEVPRTHKRAWERSQELLLLQPAPNRLLYRMAKESPEAYRRMASCPAKAGAVMSRRVVLPPDRTAGLRARGACRSLGGTQCYRWLRDLRRDDRTVGPARFSAARRRCRALARRWETILKVSKLADTD